MVALRPLRYGTSNSQIRVGSGHAAGVNTRICEIGDQNIARVEVVTAGYRNNSGGGGDEFAGAGGVRSVDN